MASSPVSWTTDTDVVVLLRMRWQRGDYLRAIATGDAWTPIEIPLRGPSPGDVAADISRAQDWVRRWSAVSVRRMRVEYRAIGGRAVGTNQLPARAWIETPGQLGTLLGVTDDIRRFRALVTLTATQAPQLVARMAVHPHRVLANAGIWSDLIATVLWIEQYAGPHTYPRQIDVPGVDTKFIESNRVILADLLDHHLGADRVDRSRPPSDFIGRYRLRRKPTLVRLRYLDPQTVEPFTDVTVRVDELAAHPVPAARVFVIENETTFLAFPATPDAIVIYGGGYAVSALRPLRWLHEREVNYWGDIDTHGFRILHRIREIFPRTRSMLMDRSTLLSHDTQWVREASPTTEQLVCLNDVEAALYRDLVEDAFGPSVRLEQERVRFPDIERAAGI